MPDITMYHGWVNYPTWLVYTAITDDRYLREVLYEKAERSNTVEELAREIKDEITDLPYDYDWSCLTCLWDLLQYALNEVSWLDIARHIWQEVYDDGEEE